MVNKPYREAIGSLQHAANTTRPDIVYSINRLASFVQNPGPAHWRAVQHVLAYIKGTLDYKITYRRGGGSSIKPLGRVDADCAGDIDTRRSTSGEVFTMSGGPVSWSLKRQATVALSTTEAEYVALARSAQQAMWMYSLCGDNMGSAALARDAKGHARVKHIDIREHYIRERVAANDITIYHVPSAQNIADVFKKSLPRDAHLACVRALGLVE
ncbi:Retrovirus-related pol polyprotein [Mycena venus]|uniref:Retrovirus-related pol polyprotein n=1 Tax=Mycena venus TaxID=2733690 RepID=A0A8H6Y507_9AGAR|nr:Retrovirus-related pol polyprotein [Mycena venus]